MLLALDFDITGFPSMWQAIIIMASLIYEALAGPVNAAAEVWSALKDTIRFPFEIISDLPAFLSVSVVICLAWYCFQLLRGVV